MAENVRRSIEFQFGVDLGSTENSIAGLERQLGRLQEEFANTEIGSEKFNKLGAEIKATASQLKTLDERFEGLTAEQKGAAIVESFNAVAGALSAASGALVVLGIKSDAIEKVEKRLLGLIAVVTGLDAVSKGLIAIGKVAPGAAAAISKVGNALKSLIVANPILATVAALGALAAAIFALNEAQKDANDELEREKKLREDLRGLYDAQNAFDKQQADNYVKELELQGKIREAEEARIEAAIRNRQTVEANAVQTINELKEQETELIKQVDTLKKVRDAEKNTAEFRQKASEGITAAFLKLTEIQNKIFLEDEKIAAAELAIEEARQKAIEARAARAEAARKKAEEESEKLAKAAVKQLEDQRQATEDLINLYTELYPEKVTGGQFEFNTELDKTNFALKEQLDILFSLNTAYEDLGDQLEEITDDFGESFFSREQLDVFKKLRDAQKTTLDLQLEDLRETYLEDLSLFSDNEEVKTQLTEQYEKDRAQLRRQFAIQTAQDILGITSQFLSVVADVNQQSLELQLAQAAGNQAKIEQINKEALERQKKLRIAQIVVSTAEAVINAFTSTSQIPPPFGQIIGGALAASYVALGAKSIATVNATTLDGGTAGGGFNNIPSGGGAFSLGGTPANLPTTGTLPGLGGGRLGSAPTVGTLEQEPIRAYVLAGDVTNGVQANIALNNRRRLAG